MTEEFVWAAKFLDGSTISQIDEEGKEHLFKEVMDKTDSLIELKLFWKTKFASVNLKTGHFNLNGEDFSFQDISDKDEKYRPIYFKRVKQTFSTVPGYDNTPNIKYNIGYQITIDGKNYQRVLCVDNLTKSMEFVEKNIPTSKIL